MNSPLHVQTCAGVKFVYLFCGYVYYTSIQVYALMGVNMHLKLTFYFLFVKHSELAKHVPDLVSNFVVLKANADI